MDPCRVHGLASGLSVARYREQALPLRKAHQVLQSGTTGGIVGDNLVIQQVSQTLRRQAQASAIPTAGNVHQHGRRRLHFGLEVHRLSVSR